MTYRSAVMRRMALAADALSHVALAVVAGRVEREPGPVIVVLAAAIFFASFAYRREGEGDEARA